MLILPVSDLHNEFQPWVPPQREENARTVLVVAGDIHTRHQAGVWLKSIASHFYAVVAVLGNHDYWDTSVENTVPRIRDDLRGVDNVYVLDRNVAVIPDIDGGAPVRFAGCTLWTHVPPDAVMTVGSTIKDFDRIRIGHGQSRIYPELVNTWHAADKKFLSDTLRTEHQGPTVVVTHHAPCSLSIDQRYKEHLQSVSLNYAYHTDMSHWACEHEFSLWLHGHTHHSFDYAFGDHGRLMCNPRGYAPDRVNPEFHLNALDTSTLLWHPVRLQSHDYASWWSNIEK